MKELSRTQLEIILLMYHKNLFLVCNEGADYKCWLEDLEGNRIQYVVKRTTGNSLSSKGWIISVPHEKDKFNRFYHQIADRFVKKIEAAYFSNSNRQYFDSIIKQVENKIGITQ